MAEPFREDYPNNPYRVDPIYIRMTEPRNTSDNRASLPSVQDLYGALSQTSQFKVSLFLGDTVGTSNADKDLNSWLVSNGVLGDNLKSLRYEFMCYSTTLPGNTFTTYDEIGSRQGLRETFPYMRTFPDFSLDFYVDSDYGVIRLFEEWMNFINPLYTTDGRAISGSPRGSTSNQSAFDLPNIYKLRYPQSYKRTMAVTKFERNTIVDSEGKIIQSSSMLTYKFLNAYPTNLTAMQLSYEGTSITKLSVQFNYDRYTVLKHDGGNSAQYGNDVTQAGDSVLFSSGQLFSDNALVDLSKVIANASIPSGTNFV